jgi:hypothetical protein
MTLIPASQEILSMFPSSRYLSSSCSYPLDLSGMGDPAGSNATAGLALRVTGTHKPLHHDKVMLPQTHLSAIIKTSIKKQLIIPMCQSLQTTSKPVEYSFCKVWHTSFALSINKLTIIIVFSKKFHNSQYKARTSF